MTGSVEAFQILLDGMREEFLSEMPERCDRFEALILALETSPSDRETFNALFRAVHSLKGAGGTHGVPVITTLCHQLENLLSEADEGQRFDTGFATWSLAHVDLLRRVAELAAQGDSNETLLVAEIERLRQAGLQSRKPVLIAESSAALAGLYRQALATLPVLPVVEADGLTALQRLLDESFDLVIVGRELKTLNGIALMAAVRASQGRNRNVPAILVSSQPGEVPAHAGFDAIVRRDAQQMASLMSAVRSALGLV